MKRRHLLIGTGTAFGGASILGSGAFSSAEARREVAVEVGDDSNAFLSLISTSEYAVEDGGMLVLDLSPSNGNVPGDGVNANATTIIESAFRVKNRGTKEVELDFLESDGNFEPPGVLRLENENRNLTVEFVPSDRNIEDTNGVFLDPGESVPYDVIVESDTDGERGDEIGRSIKITAEAIE